VTTCRQTFTMRTMLTYIKISSAFTCHRRNTSIVKLCNVYGPQSKQLIIIIDYVAERITRVFYFMKGTHVFQGTMLEGMRILSSLGLYVVQTTEGGGRYKEY